jgi:putative endonuclease
MGASGMTSTRELGLAYESLATEYLEKQGLILITRNFQCRLGEIDCIFQQQDNVVFVEVRFRKNKHFGSAADSVDFHKRQKLIRAAQIFLKLKPKLAEYACRFDVIAITLEHGQPSIEWIQDAFQS